MIVFIMNNGLLLSDSSQHSFGLRLLRQANDDCDRDHYSEHNYTHLLEMPNEASGGMRGGADLRNPSLVKGWRRISWVARYCCSSLAVTKPDLTPSRLRAIKSLSAVLFLVDIVWVRQLEIAKRERNHSMKILWNQERLQ